MFPRPLTTFFSVLAAVSAITITEPQQGAQLDLSGSNTISWTSVDTDPGSFEIVLVAPNNFTVAQSVITNSVNTAEHTYTFSNFVTPVGDGYQINFIGNVGSNTGIISQSQTFSVTKSGVESTATSGAGPSSTGTGASASASASGTSAGSTIRVTFGIAGPMIAAISMLF